MNDGKELLDDNALEDKGAIEDNSLKDSMEKHIEVQKINMVSEGTEMQNGNKVDTSEKNDNVMLEICIDIASAIILIIGCIGGLIIAKDSLELSLASILLSFSIVLILLSIKKLTIIETEIYEQLQILNSKKDKLDLK